MPLPSRKRHKLNPTTLPKDFLTNVSKLFKKEFQKKLKGETFLVYGDLYAGEVILCVSLSHPKSLRAASMHISADMPKDMAEQPEKVTERLKGMVDVASSWFAQSLENGEGLDSVFAAMADIEPTWQELDWEGAALFVKINRDNYVLERAADDLLKKSGFDSEEDSELEDLLNEIDEEEGGRGPLQ